MLTPPHPNTAMDVTRPSPHLPSSQDGAQISTTRAQEGKGIKTEPWSQGGHRLTPTEMDWTSFSSLETKRANSFST